ncbi:MAG: ribosome silencing factor [Oscillospiraceae bacterium]|nr:ribosome silencing factor [Oscillospiraceae bacterium]MDE7041420.1 ribosome silencing factor [Oscillospiraceae bacterium]
MTPKELAILAAKALDGKKGEEIKIMEVTELTTLADYFVICTGSSNTQINALCDAVEEQLETEAGEKPLHREGHRGGIWVLLDYGCLVVHVFNTEAREFYGLERLWNDGKPLDVAALLAE